MRRMWIRVYDNAVRPAHRLASLKPIILIIITFLLRNEIKEIGY
jgi:hypothetical protein